jgi:hypothetical protein
MVLCKELERFDAGPALSIRPLAASVFDNIIDIKHNKTRTQII